MVQKRPFDRRIRGEKAISRIRRIQFGKAYENCRLLFIYTGIETETGEV